MSETVQVETRDLRGKRHARRLRAAGQIPAVLYGHGKENMSLAIPGEQMAAALRHGAHLLELRGAVKQTALVKEVQWDPFGAEVLHVDLTRVDADEMVEVTLSIELRGDAPGTHQGGILEHAVHQVQVECAATEIPEKLELNVNALDVGQSLTAADLDLPAGGKLLLPDDTMIVQCVEPTARPEVAEEELVGETAEPEVIGRAEGESGEDGA
jgi:large subunit ribosomal protein L25